ncbi:hypothetical protein TSAR_014742 [Trichomalopsis sarcophagae]|uniref:Uncharacterized protein n=1 Tax=Trichomalopsis sarcophagae TaxID=543379 RepID=A0A232EDD1_9HYME|nr:hypothetical protein TSAR_014742 [Trichomalopsis sarcophagae]
MALGVNGNTSDYIWKIEAGRDRTVRGALSEWSTGNYQILCDAMSNECTLIGLDFSLQISQENIKRSRNGAFLGYSSSGNEKYANLCQNCSRAVHYANTVTILYQSVPIFCQSVTNCAGHMANCASIVPNCAINVSNVQNVHVFVQLCHNFDTDWHSLAQIWHSFGTVWHTHRFHLMFLLSKSTEKHACQMNRAVTLHSNWPVGLASA